MNKRIMFWSLAIMSALTISMCFVSCDDDDDSKSGYKGKWYSARINEESIKVEKSDKQNTLREKIQEGFTKTSDYFESDGLFKWPYRDDPNLIELHQYAQSYEVCIHFINSNTLEVFYTDYDMAYKLGSSGASGKLLLYSIDLGSVVGKVGQYAYGSSGTAYTYEKIDNKIYVPLWGEIFTIIGDDLLRDGGGRWTPFTPGKAY